MSAHGLRKRGTGRVAAFLVGALVSYAIASNSLVSVGAIWQSLARNLLGGASTDSRAGEGSLPSAQFNVGSLLALVSSSLGVRRGQDDNAAATAAAAAAASSLTPWEAYLSDDLNDGSAPQDSNTLPSNRAPLAAWRSQGRAAPSIIEPAPVHGEIATIFSATDASFRRIAEFHRRTWKPAVPGGLAANIDDPRGLAFAIYAEVHAAEMRKPRSQRRYLIGRPHSGFGNRFQSVRYMLELAIATERILLLEDGRVAPFFPFLYVAPSEPWRGSEHAVNTYRAEELVSSHAKTTTKFRCWQRRRSLHYCGVDRQDKAVNVDTNLDWSGLIHSTPELLANLNLRINEACALRVKLAAVARAGLPRRGASQSAGSAAAGGVAAPPQRATGRRLEVVGGGSSSSSGGGVASSSGHHGPEHDAPVTALSPAISDSGGGVGNSSSSRNNSEANAVTHHEGGSFEEEHSAPAAFAPIAHLPSGSTPPASKLAPAASLSPHITPGRRKHVTNGTAAAAFSTISHHAKCVQYTRKRWTSLLGRAVFGAQRESLKQAIATVKRHIHWDGVAPVASVRCPKLPLLRIGVHIRGFIDVKKKEDAEDFTTQRFWTCAEKYIRVAQADWARKHGFNASSAAASACNAPQSTLLYVASDAPSVRLVAKQRLAHLGRIEMNAAVERLIHTNNLRAAAHSVDAAREMSIVLTDWTLLSESHLLIGTATSTFSETAASVHGIPLVTASQHSDECTLRTASRLELEW